MPATQPKSKILAAFASLVLFLIAMAAWASATSLAQQTPGEGLGNWSQINIPALNNGNEVYAVRRFESLVVVGTKSQGLFRSTDGGGNWQQIPQYTNAYVRDVWIDPDDGQIALAATYGNGLLRSTNAGATWSTVGLGIGSDVYYTLSGKGGKIFVGTANNGVYRSLSGGATWGPTERFGSPGALSLASVSADIVYAGSTNNGIYKSRDGGINWATKGFSGKSVRAIAVDARDSQQLYISVLNQGVFRSLDTGQTWQQINNGLPNQPIVSLLISYASGQRLILAGTLGSGVFQFNGNTWSPFGLGGLSVFGLSDWQGTIYAGTNNKVWEYSFPSTPTRTPTITPTRTPTPTSTPTPGLKLLVVRNYPWTAISPGEEIRYTIDYRNGPAPLTDFRVTNAIPVGVTYVAGSASAGGALSGSAVQWDLGTLPGNAAGSVSFRVVKPVAVTATSTPTATRISTPTRTPTPTATRTPVHTDTPTPTATPTATSTACVRRIQGTVFNDLNQNGTFQVSSEPRLAGATLTLQENGATYTTGNGGFYVFNLPEPGTYHIQETDPPGFISLPNSPNNRTVEVGECEDVILDFGDVEQSCAIQDFSFEQGPPPASAWTESTNNACEWIGNFSSSWGITTSHHGVNSYWAAGYCSNIPSTDSVAQTITVPPAATNPILTFWILSYRPNADDPTPEDLFSFKINGVTRYSRYMTQANNTYPNWQQVSINMSGYGGQTVQLKFGADSFGTLTGNVMVDDIRLGNCTLAEFESPGDPLVAPDEQQSMTVSEPERSSASPASEVIINSGAQATWRHNGQPGQMTSNQVTNPGGLIWLPVIHK